MNRITGILSILHTRTVHTVYKNFSCCFECFGGHYLLWSKFYANATLGSKDSDPHILRHVDVNKNKHAMKVRIIIFEQAGGGEYMHL